MFEDAMQIDKLKKKIKDLTKTEKAKNKRARKSIE